MSKTAIVKIDGDKLRDIFSTRGLNPNDLSEKLGYARPYLTTCARKGYISAPCMRMLMQYNIQLDDIAVDEPEEVVPEEPEKEVESTPLFDYDRLGEVIYKAVYAAVKAAWEDS